MNHSELYPSAWYQMMKLYKKNGKDKKVLQLYKEYQILNGEPNEYHFNLVMHLNPYIMKHPENSETYSTICEIIQNKMKQNQSNVYLSKALFSYHAQINDLEGTIRTFNKMDIKHKDKYVYGKVLKLYLDNNMEDEVVKLFFSNEMFNGRTDMVDDRSCVMALKACSKIKDTENGEKIHRYILDSNCNNIQLLTTLVTFYGKIGKIEDAREVFDKINMKDKNVICYNAMMQAYLDNKKDKEVVEMYNRRSRQMIDDVSCVLALKACSNIKDNKNGEKICNFILDNRQYDNLNNVQLVSTLIAFYGKIGQVSTAMQILDGTDNRTTNVVCYNAMMQAYLDNDMNSEAIRLFFSDKMCNESWQAIDQVSCLLALKACGNTKDKENGKKIHKFILNNRKYASFNNIELFNTLTTFYGKIGEIDEAIGIFDSKKDSCKSVSCYNAMMQAYLDNDMNEDVIRLFFSKDVIHRLDHISCLIALKACCNTTDAQNGEKIRNIILYDKKYTSWDNIELFNTLISFYGKIGEIAQAMKIFDQISIQDKNVVSYVVMMQAYLENNMNEAAMKLFFSNPTCDNNNISNVSCMLGLKACGNMKDTESGRKIHNIILGNRNRKESSWNNIELSNTLIAFYGKIGEIYQAVKIFNQIDSQDKNVVCYNSMMQAYLDGKMNKEVIGIFFSNEMFYASPPTVNDVSYLVALKACGNAQSYYEFVKQIDDKLRDDQQRLFQDDRLVSQLISCYGKLGYVEKSAEIFDKYLQLFDSYSGRKSKTVTDTIIVFSSMMNSYGRNNLASKSIQLFAKLKHDAMYSNRFSLLCKSLKMKDIEAITSLYITLISSCSHSGLVEEAKQFYLEYDNYYNSLLNELKRLNWHNIHCEKLNRLPVCHSNIHCALVDAFARKGLLNQAWKLCTEYENNICSETSFLALLSGCRKYNNQDVATKTFAKIKNLVLRENAREHSREYLKSMLASSSVLTQHILISIGKQDDANTINWTRKRKGWYKQRGVSEIVIPGDPIGIVHSFSAGDEYKKDYPDDWEKMDQLWNKWQIELKKDGFKHDHNCMTRQLRDTETVEYVLCRHAEKLALAYGVLRIKDKDVIIHINKNMRMCADCHEATKRIAQIEAREIRVADAHAIHIFDGHGNCSCGDYY